MKCSRSAILISISTAILILLFTPITHAALSGGAIQGQDLILTPSNAQVTTLAGSIASSGSTDGTGSAARFNLPEGITADGKNRYVADEWNSTIRNIEIDTGEVATLAGTVAIARISKG